MDSTDPRRQRPSRSNVLLVAAIDTADRSQQVKLRNLSATGALVEGLGLVDEGREVLFRRNDTRIVGRIVWVRGDLAGISFGATIDSSALLRHIPIVAKPVPKPAWLYRRPGFGPRKLTQVEQRWLHQWSARRP